MKLSDKLKKLGTQMGTSAICAVKELDRAINACAERHEATARLMNLAGVGFTRDFQFTADQICYCRITDNTETYISLVDEAIEMLASGCHQADVLAYFEKVLMKEKVG